MINLQIKKILFNNHQIKIINLQSKNQIIQKIKIKKSLLINLIKN